MKAPTVRPEMLTVEHLSKSYGDFIAVQDVSFTLRSGELVALIGPNGAGKSTCFNMLNGQLKPTRGKILLRDRDITQSSPASIWRQGVGRTFQITATFRTMTVRENVQMALMSHHRGLNALWSYATRQHTLRANELLAMVGMHEQAERACGILAYGDLKRLELAIALANDPALLLMDEPTAGMGPVERDEMMALTARIVSENGIAVLFTAHDMEAVFGYAHRVMVMARGELIAEGRPEQVRFDPQVKAVYLGSGITYGEGADAAGS